MKFNPIVEISEKFTNNINDHQWQDFLHIMKPRLELSNRIAVMCTEDVDVTIFEKFYGWVSELHERYSLHVTKEPLFGTSALYNVALNMEDFEVIPYCAAIDTSAGIACLMYNPLHAEAMDKFLRKEVLGEN